MEASSGERIIVKFGLLLVTVVLLAGALLAVTAVAVAPVSNAVAEDHSDFALGGSADTMLAGHSGSEGAVSPGDGAERLKTFEAAVGGLERIEVIPGEVELKLGEQQEFIAIGYDALGAEVPITATWAADGGKIDGTGLYTASMAGEWAVTAMATGSSITGTATVHVAASHLARIEVMPVEVDLKLGEQQEFSVTGYDELGAEVPITPTWSADGGTIDETGLYTATEEGDWTATASQGEVQGISMVHVGTPVLDRIEVTPFSAYLEEGRQQMFTARGFSDSGEEMTITPMWSAGGGSISQGGLYTAGSLPGSYPVTAEASVGAVTRRGQARAQIVGPLPSDLAPGQSYCHLFPYAGAYPYYDGWNSDLRGTVVVTTADLAPVLSASEVAKHIAVTVPVSIAADGFAPPSVTVGSDDTVCWTNADVVTHAIRGGVYTQRVFMPLMLGEYPPPLPPREWDPRLDELGVTVEDAQVGPGEPQWRLVAARWADKQESGGLHHIFFDVLDEGEERVVGQPVVVEWSTGSVTVYIEDKPPTEPGANFPMNNTLGSYTAYVGGEHASDRVVGMGMGTPEQPAHTIHTSFFLTFQWVPLGAFGW